jgi:integrase
VLSGAVDDELLDTNPAGRLGKYLGGDRRMLKTPITPYTFDETDRFLRRCQIIAPDYYDFFFVGFRTGMREGELIELRWSEDFADHRPTQVHVQRNFSYPQYQEDRQRGGPSAQAGITTPKGNRDRYVDLSPQVVAVLKARRTAMRAAAFAAGRPMPELVFTAPRGGRVNPRNLLRRTIPDICTRALPDGPKPVRPITIHTVRHSFVTQMLLKHGIGQLPAISQQIGHRDVSTTERHYAHWITEHRDVLAKRLDEPIAQVVSMWGGESDHD